MFSLFLFDCQEEWATSRATNTSSRRTSCDVGGCSECALLYRWLFSPRAAFPLAAVRGIRDAGGKTSHCLIYRGRKVSSCSPPPISPSSQPHFFVERESYHSCNFALSYLRAINQADALPRRRRRRRREDGFRSARSHTRTHRLARHSDLGPNTRYAATLRLLLTRLFCVRWVVFAFSCAARRWNDFLYMESICCLFCRRFVGCFVRLLGAVRDKGEREVVTQNDTKTHLSWLEQKKNTKNIYINIPLK